MALTAEQVVARARAIIRTSKSEEAKRLAWAAIKAANEGATVTGEALLREAEKRA